MTSRGIHTFVYDAAWPASPQARPLSLSLPLGSAKPCRGDRVLAYCGNLLPTAAVPRQRLQSLFRAASTDTFDLLTAAGRDCAGAVQLLPPDVDPGDPMRVDGDPLSESDLVHMLACCAGTLASIASPVEQAIDRAAASLPTGFASSVSEPVFEGLRRGARALSA